MFRLVVFVKVYGFDLEEEGLACLGVLIGYPTMYSTICLTHIPNMQLQYWQVRVSRGLLSTLDFRCSHAQCTIDLGLKLAPLTLDFLAPALNFMPFALYLVSLITKDRLCSFADVHLVWRDTTQKVQ